MCALTLWPKFNLKLESWRMFFKLFKLIIIIGLENSRFFIEFSNLLALRCHISIIWLFVMNETYWYGNFLIAFPTKRVEKALSKDRFPYSFFSPFFILSVRLLLCHNNDIKTLYILWCGCFWFYLNDVRAQNIVSCIHSVHHIAFTKRSRWNKYE